MEGEKNFKIDGINIKCVGYYGYNNHYYVTMYNDDSGEYLGQLTDAKLSESNIEKRITDFVKSVVKV